MAEHDSKSPIQVPCGCFGALCKFWSRVIVGKSTDEPAAVETTCVVGTLSSGRVSIGDCKLFQPKERSVENESRDC